MSYSIFREASERGMLVEAFSGGRELFKGEVKIRKDRSAEDSREPRMKEEGRIKKEEVGGAADTARFDVRCLIFDVKAIRLRVTYGAI